MNSEVFENCSTILLDIAGTVGSINYTKDTLFAFAKKNVEEYLKSKWEEEETKKLVAELKGDGDDLPDVSKAVERFNALTDENSINAGVKTLQGLLYKQGYENGELKAHVFDDIKRSLEEWSKYRKICIYSTGAEEAQKQYFAHSTAGDLSTFIARYFDQAIGAKTAAESYEKIAKNLEVKPQEVVFLSDDIEEIKAAAQAGCTTVLVTREGNADVADAEKVDRIVVSSFTDLPLSAKRKNSDEASSEGPPAKVAKLATDDKVEKEAEKPAETTMEVDSSEATPAASNAEEAPTKTEEPAKEVAESATTTTVDSSEKTEEPMETASTSEEKTEKPATSTTEEKPATPAKEAATETTEKSQECEVDTSDKTETVEEASKPAAEKETKPEETSNEAAAVEQPTEAAPAAETTSSTEAAKSTPAVEEAKADEDKAVVESEAEPKKAEAEVAKENGEKAAEVVENGKTNGSDAAGEEKENKSDVANGTADVAADNEKKCEKNGTAEGVESAEEVKVKKIDEATENTAPVTVEA